MPQIPDSSASSSMASKRRCNSGIPRPASGTSRRSTSSTLQTIPVEVSRGSILPSSYNAILSRPPRSDSLQSARLTSSPDQDLSGLRQQLHVRNFSIQSVQGLEQLSFPRNSAPRSLMRPLGPPLPRSNTVGVLPTFFEKTAASENKRQISKCVAPRPSNASLEIDVVDALSESRMTREELELLNRVEKEKRLNTTRLLGNVTTGSTVMFPTCIQTVDQELGLKTSSSMLPVTAATRAKIQLHARRKTAEGFGKSGLHIDAALANTRQTPRASLPTPGSAITIASSEDRQIGPRYVYFSEPITYWTGRYMALCDKSKTEDLDRSAMTVGWNVISEEREEDDHAKRREPYEAVERQRIRNVLNDLRSCCKTDKALKSFARFEETLLSMPSGTPTATNVTASAASGTAISDEKTVTLNKLKHPWLCGPVATSITATSSSSSVPKTISGKDFPPIAGKASNLVKSQTTGNLAFTEPKAAKHERVGIACSTVIRSVNMQYTKQASTLSIQAQMNARALRNREERAAMRVDETMRRVNSGKPSSKVVSGHSSNHENQIVPMQRKPIEKRARTIQIRQSSPASQKEEESAVAMVSDYGRPLAGPPANRNVSIATSRIRFPSQDKMPVRTHQDGEPTELRRRTNRQSSSELLKSMVTGGLKGVRKMGRSLTGKSEPEDLSQDARVTNAGTNTGEDRWIGRDDEIGAVL